MNQVEKIFNESHGVQQFARGYIDYLYLLLKHLDFESVERFAEELECARQQERTIFVVGNGGSTATASHLANDFGDGILKKSGAKPPFRVHSLSDSLPTISAIANDEGYENIFVNQLRIHYRQGDMLVAISASGNSPNVLAAAEWVKEKGGKVASLVGFDGGRLADISDVTVLAETMKGEYGPVEDIHLIVNHLLANWFEYTIRLGEDK